MSGEYAVFGPLHISNKGASALLVVWPLQCGNFAFGVLDFCYEGFAMPTWIRLQRCEKFGTLEDALETLGTHKTKGYESICRHLLMERTAREERNVREGRSVSDVDASKFPTFVCEARRDQDTGIIDMAGFPFALPKNALHIQRNTSAQSTERVRRFTVV